MSGRLAALATAGFFLFIFSLSTSSFPSRANLQSNSPAVSRPLWMCRCGGRHSPPRPSCREPAAAGWPASRVSPAATATSSIFALFAPPSATLFQLLLLFFPGRRNRDGCCVVLCVVCQRKQSSPDRPAVVVGLAGMGPRPRGGGRSSPSSPAPAGMARAGGGGNWGNGDC